MDPAKLKVVELRAELSKRGLDSKGNKPVLVERLRQALEEEKGDSKEHVETSQQFEPKFDSEDEKSNSESKSPEQAKLPPRTPSRTSRARRSTSREPSTPARTPSRRSNSRSSVSRQSPVKNIVAENLTESAVVLEPIVEEAKSPISETVATSPEKKSVIIIKKDKPVDTPKKKLELSPMQRDDQKSLLTPEKVSPKTIISTSPEIDNSLDLSKKDVVPAEETSEQNEEIESNKSSQLEIVKEAEQHIHDSAQEITKKTVDDLDRVVPEKNNSQSPAKIVAHSEDKILQSQIEGSENSTASITQSPAKPFTQKPTDTTFQSPVKIVAESAGKDVIQINTKLDSPQKVEQSSIKDEESPNEKLKNDTADSIIIADEVEGKSVSCKSNYESMEVDHGNDIIKTNLKDKDDSEKLEDRKRKRSPSPSEEASRPPPIARPEMEPKYDESAVLLSWYDSDLNLVIDSTDYFTASTMQGDGFNYMWAGVRSSYGYSKGKVFFEARINSEFDNMSTAAGTSVSGAISADEEKMPSALRLGWSSIGTSLQLGEENFSYGYANTGKKCTNNEFTEYGIKFAKNDVIACYADFETNEKVTLTYTVNGEKQEPAFVINHEEFNNKILFPHVLSKNCSFKVNFGQEEHWSNEVLDGYQFVGKVNFDDRIAGPSRPKKREDCEVILLCGLPFSGKTAWALKHAAEHPEKLYNILGTHNLIEKMKIDGVSFKEIYKGHWETVIEKCTRAVTKLLDFAPSRRRNYILDQQSNVYGSAQKRKMRNFYGFHRKAVILVPSDEDFKARIAKRKKEVGGEEIRESSILEVKANLTEPTVGESFEEVIWAELPEEEGKQVIASYNAEGKTAGYGQSPQQINKRSRFDNNQKDRNNRENRDYRRSTHNDRRVGGTWRGGGGWRDGNRMRGGPVRHGGNYGPPTGPWRGRGGGLPLPPRSGGERRPGGGSNDRRQGNDRNRSGGAVRTGGWNAMGYQGNQHGNAGVWNVQGNWQGQSQTGWSGQQPSGGNNWGQQAWGGASNWKGYGQSMGYGQSSSGYGNGHWNNWNPQYYNQYWSGSGQQQQTSGQTSGQTQMTTGSTASSQVLSKK